MIPRYESPEIAHIFSDHHRFETFLKVELALLKTLEGEKIPKGISEKIKSKVVINPDRIAQIEKTTRHDVIAFCTSITEQLPDEIGRFFHFGATSSDIIDTALSLQIKEALHHIIHESKELLGVLFRLAWESKDMITMGRTHGMRAEPMSFGVKLLGHYAEFSRRFEEYQKFHDHELTGQFSGAVGGHTLLSPEIESQILKQLELAVEPISTQVIPRDRLAKLISLGALTAGAIERMVVEIRHLHRSELSEVQEGMSSGQKGSSIMPHKKNPISCENLTGISRILRSHALIAWENIPLWHERDISHSSTERVYLPDHFGLLHYALIRLKNTLNHLQLNKDKMELSVQEERSYLSSYYLHLLIEKTSFSRETIYRWVQKAAFSGNLEKELARIIKKEGVSLNLPSLDHSQITHLYLKHTDNVFKRIKRPTK